MVNLLSYLDNPYQRRHFSRVRLAHPPVTIIKALDISNLDSTSYEEGQIIDVSLSGLRLKLKTQFDPGQDIQYIPYYTPAVFKQECLEKKDKKSSPRIYKGEVVWVKREKEDNKRQRWLLEEEEKQLLAVCPDWLRDVVIFAILM